jgi:hypothetical protein
MEVSGIVPSEETCGAMWVSLELTQFARGRRAQREPAELSEKDKLRKELEGNKDNRMPGVLERAGSKERKRVLVKHEENHAHAIQSKLKPQFRR